VNLHTARWAEIMMTFLHKKPAFDSGLLV